MRRNKSAGITLIALVVTIIVLLILAGISIGMLSGDNSIIKNARNAKTGAKIAEEKETIEMAVVKSMEKNKSGDLVEKELQEELENVAEVTTIRKKLVVTFENGRSYEVDSAGNVLEYKKVDVEKLAIMDRLIFRDNISQYKTDVLTIKVLNELNVPSTNDGVFDVSKNKDGSIKIWLIKNETDNTKYDLYIGGKDGVRIDQGEGLFGGFTACTEMDLQNLYTDGITSMRSMFRDCKKIKNLDLSGFETSQVINLEATFLGCEELESLDVSTWNTGNVKIMSDTNGTTGVFTRCRKLKEIDLSNWNTENVTLMAGMFRECNSLDKLDVSNFKTDKVMYMGGAFVNCYELQSLDLSGWNTENVTNLNSIFMNCNKLERTGTENWNTQNVEDMTNAFANCRALKSVDISKWDISKLKNTSYMFNGCGNLETIYASQDWKSDKITSSTKMFNNARKLSGAIGYDGSKIDINYANYTNGYFTYKSPT